MTLSAAPLAPQKSPLPHLSPLGMLNGIFWMGMLVVHLFGVVEDSLALRKSCHADVATEQWGHLIESTRRAFESSVGAVGSGAYAAQWTHEVDWIDLGQALEYVRGLVYGTTLLNSALRMLTLSIDLLAEKRSARPKSEQINLNLTRLAAHVTMAAWGVLGLSALMAGTPFSAGLSLSLLTISLCFSVAAWRYKRHYGAKNLL